MPKELGGGRGSKPIRISLGAMPQREARRLADLMAGEARRRFDAMRVSRMDDRDDRRTGSDGSARPEGEVPQVFEGDSHAEVLAELRGYFKFARQHLDRSPMARPTEAELKDLEGLRGLVQIEKELRTGTASPLVLENLDLLRQKYIGIEADAARRAKGGPSQATGSSDPVPTSAPPVVTPTAAASIPQPVPAVPATVVPGPPSAVAAGGDGKRVPAYKLDRRTVARPPSDKPLFSVVSDEYLDARTSAKGEENKDVRIARTRRDLFIELIGDHPVDTYDAADLQAYIEFLKYWPGDNNQRRRDWTARQIVEDNRDLHLKPLSRNALVDGYVSIVKTMINSGTSTYGYRNPVAGVKLHYPDTAARPVSAEPLSSVSITRVFRTGVGRGMLDEAMLPLLGHLTGRRLGLLIHLTGNDIRQKYPGVFTAQTNGILLVNGKWTRVPIKTEASMTFFVLHEFLVDIGFVDWAMRQGDEFLFRELMRLDDPSKSASSYMQRLFKRAEVEGGDRREVFHSLRAGNIDTMRNAKIEARARKLQAGHAIGDSEHDLYGFRSLNEFEASEMATLPLNPKIDFSVFRGLDFDKLANAKRTMGRRRNP